MEPNRFEELITAGKARWIRSFTYDDGERKLTVGLIGDPGRQSGETRLLEFEGVLKVDVDWTDRDDERIEGLLGAHEERGGTNPRYILATDQREIQIEVESTRTPRVYDL